MGKMDRTIGDVLIDHAKVAKSFKDFEKHCTEIRQKTYRKILEKGGTNGNSNNQD